MNDIHKTRASHTDLKPRFVLVVHSCTLYITCRCSVFLKFVNEGIVNIQVLCSIPLAWTWRYCQWYWQCLHIQTKGALITCINHCHLLVLTLLCLVDLWKLDESISSFKGVWCIYFYFISYRNTCMQTLKILIIRHALRRLISKSVRSGPALFAYVHFYRTLCRSGLSNVPEIFQFHDCNVTLYTAKIPLLLLCSTKRSSVQRSCQRGQELLTWVQAFIYFLFFSLNNTIKCL